MPHAVRPQAARQISILQSSHSRVTRSSKRWSTARRRRATGKSLAWLGKHERVFGHYIGGAWTEPGELFDVINPATSQGHRARRPTARAADVDAAVAAAQRALPKWKALAPHARARYLYALARGVQKHSRLLAVLESMDNGKSIRETRDIDVPLVARHFYHHAGWAQLLDSEFAGYEAIGVVGQIIPWNFPLLMLAWKIAPAHRGGKYDRSQAGGVHAAHRAVLRRDRRRSGDSGRRDQHRERPRRNRRGDRRTIPDVDKIAFTGSTEVGRIIRKATAGSGKKLSLELGGKSPFIVYDDADLDSVVEGVVDAIWFNQGQVCCAGSRLLVQEGVAERLVAKLRARMEKLRVGSPLDKAVDMGAIVAPVQLERIRGLVEQGVD